jgi:hypothetical protein
MAARNIRAAIHALGLGGSFLVLACFSGCRELPWRETGFRDNEAVYKPEGKTEKVGDAAGLSRKARDVERNLGYE